MTGIRKMLAVALVLLMTAGLLLSGCFGNGAEEKIHCAEEKAQLLEQWEGYLACVEDVQNTMDWTFGYAEEFFTTDSWETLLKARAACAAAEYKIRRIPAPEFTLTDEQCGLLNKAGIETDAVRSEFLALPGWMAQQTEALTNLETMLEWDFILSAEFSGMPAWLETNRGFQTDTAEYLCLMTNYLLVQAEDKSLWESFPDRYPCLSRGMGAWSEDLKTLMTQGTEVLSRYEERIGELEVYGGLQEYSLKIIQEAAETGDLTYLAEALHLPAGIPGCFPDMGWLTEETERIYLKTEEMLVIEAGEDLTEIPAGCYISCPGVSRAEVEAYYDNLIQWGFRATEKWEEAEGKYVVFAIHESCSLLVEWTAEKTLVYLPEPVGALIPNLYLMALQVE